MAKKPTLRKKSIKKEKAVLKKRKFGSAGVLPSARPAQPSLEEAERKIRAAEALQPVRGMHDRLPKDEIWWDAIERTTRTLLASFGYARIDTPIMEQKSLFARGLGDFTDVVQKEMYCFKDQGGDEVCLRPEATASVSRAYVNHGMLNLPQPVKLWYCGPFFRRERPQSGRYRQFHQWGLEILGDAHPILDAEAISIAIAFFKDLEVPVRLEVNSLGCGECRPPYVQTLADFYRPKQELLCEVCKGRLARSPLRLLDCKETQCILLKEGAPQGIDALCESCRNHFMQVLEYLEDVAIAYEVNPHLVRGLDYYTRTVFEIFPTSEVGSRKSEVSEEVSATENETPRGEDEEDPSPVPRPPSSGAQSALGSGGRYDGLIEQLGGRLTPAVGCAIGIERVVAVMRERGLRPAAQYTPRIFIAQLGEAARRRAFALWHILRGEVPVAVTFSKDGLKAQLEAANRLGVRYAVIIGQKEVIDQTAIIRDMEAGIQEVVDYNKVVSAIKKKLE